MQISGSVSLDSKLADCVVGEEKQITLTVTPTRNDSGGFEADVTGLEEYSEEDDEAGEKPKPKKKVSRDEDGPSDHVLMIGIGKAKPKAY